jgi:hypothetical protein
MASTISQFLTLGDPTDTHGDHAEWIIDLPAQVHADKTGVLLFRIKTASAPHVIASINSKAFLDREFPKGDVVSYHGIIPSNVFRPGQNRVIFEWLDLHDVEAEPWNDVADITLFYRESI